MLRCLRTKRELNIYPLFKKGMYLTSLVHKMTSFYSKGSMMIPFVCIKLYLDMGIDGNESITFGEGVWSEHLIFNSSDKTTSL